MEWKKTIYNREHSNNNSNNAVDLELKLLRNTLDRIRRKL